MTHETHQRPDDGLTEQFQGYEDAYGVLTVKNWNNNIDVASHYEFSPERIRLFKNGSRQFVQYGETSNFRDEADVWVLSPAGGDTMHIETAESAQYTVNYNSQLSLAFSLNQSLQSGDRLRVGPYNGTDGWFLEQRGADHSDTQADIIQSIGGTETTLESDVDLVRPTTEFIRYQTEYTWYNVGSQVWTQTFASEGGQQRNEEIAETGTRGVRGPETGNLNVYAEVQADANTTGLELNCGSMAMNTRGNTQSIDRNKPQRVTVSFPATDNTWVPIYAIRVKPENENVNSQLVELSALSYNNQTEFELLAVNFDKNKTDASNWTVADYQHAQNSVLEVTTNISEVPNTSGTQTVLGSTEKFGGYTLAASVISSSGNTTSSTATVSPAQIERKSILRSDHTVILGRTPNGGAQLRFVWDVDQNW